jgi:hypothetical protein
MHPLTSVLFANTSRLAPESRFSVRQLWVGYMAAGNGHAHLLLEQTMQLFSAVVDAQPVCGVDNPDQGVCFLKVIAPVWPQRFLAADIP